MKTLNWRLAFAALIACVSALALAGCPQQDEPDGTPTSDVVPDTDTTDNDATDDTTDDATDDVNDQDMPGEDMNDEGPLDDATGNPMDDSTDDATDAPTP